MAKEKNKFSKLSGESRPLARVGEIILSDVSKSFWRSSQASKSYSTLKTSLLGKFFSLKHSEDSRVQTTALDGVSLHVEPGQSLGVIGRNGSGKSTILKLIAGIYQPDNGYVSSAGRISALIELGAGFHPDFTGRENLILGGIMYGLSKREIESRVDEIVAYAELQKFIDDPVRTYSSGMYMRLGFSLAVHTEPDILLVDEVLAVGDAAFVHRCRETVSELKRKGTTLLLVTHDLDSVERWCDEAVWLTGGVVRERGTPRRVIDSYLAAVTDKEGKALDSENSLSVESETSSGAEEASEHSDKGSGEGDKRWGNRKVEIVDVKMINSSGDTSWIFSEEDSVEIVLKYQIHKAVSSLVFGIGLLRGDGLVVHGNNTEIEKVDVPLPDFEDSSAEFPLEGVVKYKLDRIGLLEGTYYLDVASHSETGAPFDYHHMTHKFSIRSKLKLQGLFSPKRSWEFEVAYDTQTPSLERKSSGVLK